MMGRRGQTALSFARPFHYCQQDWVDTIEPVSTGLFKMIPVKPPTSVSWILIFIGLKDVNNIINIKR